MGEAWIIAADLIAALEGCTRQQLDTFAAASQARAATALQDGRFAKSVIPVQDKAGQIVLDHDANTSPDGSQHEWDS